MASVVIADETVIVVSRESLARAVADPTRWASWWPGLAVTVLADRGLEGMEWAVAGPLVGTCAVVLVGAEGGVVVRYALDADPTEPGSRTSPRRLPNSPHGRRELQALRHRHLMAWKRTVWALKEELEAQPRSAAWTWSGT